MLVKSEYGTPTKSPVYRITWALPRAPLNPIQSYELAPHLVDTLSYTFRFVVSDSLEGYICPSNCTMNFVIARDGLLMLFKNIVESNPPLQKTNR